MNKKLTVIHTTPATVSTMPTMIKEKYPNVEIINIMDDSLLNDIKKEGTITGEVIERFIQYAIIASDMSDGILLACSSIGDAADVARNFIKVPIFKIDEPMAEKAIENGPSILVLGTVQSTLDPTCNLIKSKASSKDIKINSQLIKGAFELNNTDKVKHDQMIAKVVEENSDKYDVIVLAQASMANAKKYISDSTKVLSSLPDGLIQLDCLLKE